MATLLLRLAGPMQAWGTQSRFSERDTERFPSRSGVIGLLCAARGTARGDSLKDLESLAFAARADMPGVAASDYQTAQRREGGVARLSRRYLLMDALFLVGLSGNRELLESLQAALRRPVWPLYLGRLAFPLALPLVMEGGLSDSSLRDAVTGWPWLGADPLVRGPRPGRPGRLQVEWELPPGDLNGEPRQDVPASFGWGARHHLQRRIRREWIPTPPLAGVGELAAEPDSADFYNDI